MAFQKADHRPKQTYWPLRVAARWRTLPTIRIHLLQWPVAVAAGLVLGLYLLVAIPWKPRWAPFFALAALFPVVSMIVGDVRKLLLAAIIVEIPLQFDRFLQYDYRAASLGAIGGFNVSATTFCLGALYALWTAELLAKATPVRRSWFRAGLPLIVYLAAVTFSVVVARDVHLVVSELFLLLQSFLLFLYIVKSVQSRQDVLFIITILLIGLVFQSMVMIGLRMIGHSISVARIFAYIDDYGRVGGTLGTPNTAASYLTLLLAPALAVLLTPLKGRYRWLAGLALGLGCIALVLTFSRGGWIAGTVSIMLLCLFAFGRGWLSPRVPLTIVAVGVLVFALFWTPITARLFGDDGGAAYSRIVMARLTLRMIKDHPVLGVGANNSAVWLEEYNTPELSGGPIFTVHNKYLLVWVETGIVGLVAFLGYLLAVIRRGWQVWMGRDRLLSPLALGFTAAIVGQMAHMLFDIFHSRPQVQTLWLIAGLITAMHNFGAEERLHSNRKAGV